MQEYNTRLCPRPFTAYLRDFCAQVASITFRYRLRSADRDFLGVTAPNSWRMCMCYFILLVYYIIYCAAVIRIHILLPINILCRSIKKFFDVTKEKCP